MHTDPKMMEKISAFIDDYYAEKKSAIYNHVWSFARTSTIVYLVLTILLSLILLKGFNQKSFEKYSGEKTVPTHDEEELKKAKLDYIAGIIVL